MCVKNTSGDRIQKPHLVSANWWNGIIPIDVDHGRADSSIPSCPKHWEGVISEVTILGSGNPENVVAHRPSSKPTRGNFSVESHPAANREKIATGSMHLLSLALAHITDSLPLAYSFADVRLHHSLTRSYHSLSHGWRMFTTASVA